jgi:6-phosphogluconate dehydrogenase
MEIGMVGLGKMGANMAKRLAKGGHRVVVYNRTVERAHSLADEIPSITATDSLEQLISKLKRPRVVWVMVPAGDATEEMVNKLGILLSKGDTLIDGSNSYYKDTMRRAQEAGSKGLSFLDVGTSGGVWGLTEGYSMMVGGERAALEKVRPIIESLAPGPHEGWGWVGPSGAGHFVKMTHNGIEYGLMEAYAEGFEILRAKKEFDLDLNNVAEIWRHGSVVRSWLLDLIAGIMSKDQSLDDVKGWVADSGEGRWTVSEAMDEAVPAPVITLSLLMRFASREDERYADKLLASLRNSFGGHEVKMERKRVRTRRPRVGRRAGGTEGVRRGKSAKG